MRILPFPIESKRKSADQNEDWSQQEIADFYRAHRLLAENGAAIGIDRGLTDIGEPWLVFFDQASQDVFLHIARIDRRCHLICDPLNLRISAANIASLILEFEAAVRSSLSIRSERAKNVIIHPAARVIMSISAVFLLFKLENSEAQAKGLADKLGVTGDLGGQARLVEKAGGAFARAHNAFARAFDSADAPATAALLAGVILAGELATSLERNAESPPTETVKAVSVPSSHGVAPLHLEGSEQHAMVVQQAKKAVQVQPPAALQTSVTVQLADNSKNAADYAFSLEHLAGLKQISGAGKGSAVEPLADLSAAILTPVELEKTSETAARSANTGSNKSTTGTDGKAKPAVDDPLNSGLLSFGRMVEGKPVAAAAEAKPAPEAPFAVSIGTLGQLTSKAGFVLKTSVDLPKAYAFEEYLKMQMGGQFTFEYQSNGTLLIEQMGIDDLKAGELGIWTNVGADQSTTSIVGRASLIDDALTFFS